MKFSIDKKGERIGLLRLKMRARALENPIVEKPMIHSIEELVDEMKTRARKNSDLEEITGLKMKITTRRTALVFSSTFPLPPEHRKMYNEYEVGVEPCIEGNQISLTFDFPLTEKTNEVNTSTASLEFNESNQLLLCRLNCIHNSFPIGNRHQFDMEQKGGRKISFGYDTRRDIAALTFSTKMPDSFEEHSRIHGTIKLYSGAELIGYEIVDFSQFYNPACEIPHLLVPR